ncbi:MAG: stage III sporulation protein AF [Clostridiaceae bacterium]|nr:stage III sporulation protein AF [Clostridiaceae bacterium]
MEFLNSWLQGIIISVVIATIVEMILPEGNNKKYVKIVLGVYVVFNIITPIINKLTQNNFEISSIINIEKYTKQFETYEVDSKNIDIENVNKTNIKNIYINNLKKDMKAKIEERGYVVENIKIKLEDSEDYIVEELIIYLDKKDIKKDNDNNNTKEIIDSINEIKIEDINISNNIIEQTKKTEDTEEKSEKVTNKNNSLSNNEKKEILNYITSVYEINENKVNIY